MKIIGWVLVFTGVIMLFIYRRPRKEGDGSFNERVDWDKVKSERGMERHSMISCPNCGLAPQELDWFEFRSPDWTWMNLCGREGYYSNCPKCDMNVDEIITCMN